MRRKKKKQSRKFSELFRDIVEDIPHRLSPFCPAPSQHSQWPSTKNIMSSKSDFLTNPKSRDWVIWFTLLLCLTELPWVTSIRSRRKFNGKTWKGRSTAMSPKHACPPLKSAFVYVPLPLGKRSEAKTSAQVQLQSHDQQGHSAG